MQIEMQWFHIILTTYGAWLPGDPRGFRTRDHREHVDGDYKSPPPPGQHAGLHAAASGSLKHDVVTIALNDRRIVANCLRERLIEKGSTLAIIAQLGRHTHLLVKLPPKLTRVWIGEAKKHAVFTLREAGRTGRLWGRSGKFVPIMNRPHQLRVYAYVERHEQQGAYIWRHSD